MLLLEYDPPVLLVGPELRVERLHQRPEGAVDDRRVVRQYHHRPCRAAGRQPRHGHRRFGAQRGGQVLDEAGAKLLVDGGPHLVELLVEHREADLDTAVQIPRHPVRAAEIREHIAARVEMEDAAVLEEAADDRAHADVLGKPRHARTERAHAANDQVDRHARRGGLVERVDDPRVGHDRVG